MSSTTANRIKTAIDTGGAVLLIGPVGWSRSMVRSAVGKSIDQILCCDTDVDPVGWNWTGRVRPVVDDAAVRRILSSSSSSSSSIRPTDTEPSLDPSAVRMTPTQTAATMALCGVLLGAAAASVTTKPTVDPPKPVLDLPKPTDIDDPPMVVSSDDEPDGPVADDDDGWITWPTTTTDTKRTDIVIAKPVVVTKPKSDETKPTDDNRKSTVIDGISNLVDVDPPAIPNQPNRSTLACLAGWIGFLLPVFCPPFCPSDSDVDDDNRLKRQQSIDDLLSYVLSRRQPVIICERSSTALSAASLARFACVVRYS